MKKKWMLILALFILGYFLFVLLGYFLLKEKARPSSGGFLYTTTNTATHTATYSTEDNSFLPSFELGSVVGGSGSESALSSALERSREGGVAANYVMEQKPAADLYYGSTPGTGPAANVTYEKVASLGIRSTDFDGDNQKIRSSIQTHKVLIQQEKNEGLEGDRQLVLTLGVIPEQFESFVEEVRKIGTLVSFEVTKTDKTGEYLALMAKRAALQKKLKDLESLKGAGGKMTELLDLQQKIFDAQNEAQKLGVEIGHFEGRAGLCTALVALGETSQGPRSLDWVGAAMEWAFWTYLKFWGVIAFGTLVTFLLLRLVEKGIFLVKVLAGENPKKLAKKPVENSKALSLKSFKVLAAVFLLLWIGRWIVEYPQSKKSSEYVPEPPASTEPNYAKENVPAQGTPATAQESIYERVATLASRTRDFDSDEKKVREIIQSNRLFLQQERNLGLPGGRNLTLALGVDPAKFDAVVEAVRQIGDLASCQVVKTDKTNDYDSLLAQQATLEKNHSDLLALKARGGKVADLLALQEKIFEVEQQMQDLGLELGHYKGATGLCTLLLALKEIAQGPSLLALAAGALGWTLSLLLGILTALFFISLGLMVLAWVVGKAKVFS